MVKRKLKLISVRIDQAQLDKAKILLGLNDTSKIIRACMNCAVNVTQGIYGGELAYVFKRRKDNEEIPLYDNKI